MYFVQLRFAGNRGEAARHMDAHKAWIARGFEDGVFLMVGSIRPDLGGAILVHNISRDALETRVQDDPFVAEGIVEAEILELAPARTDERLAFLKTA